MRGFQILQPMEQSGVGIDGSKFAFDGIVHLNLVLSNEKGKTFELSYDPVLVSSQVHLIFLVSIQRKNLHHVVAILRTFSDFDVPYKTTDSKMLS